MSSLGDRHRRVTYPAAEGSSTKWLEGFERQINEHELYFDHSFVPHDKIVDKIQRFETSLGNSLRVTDLHGRWMHTLAFLISF